MRPSLCFCLCLGLLAPQPLWAAEYSIDPSHAFIEFRTKHLGFSWLYGRFNRLQGDFSWDSARPETSRISVVIDTRSLDSNHAERDKHLRSDKFLDTRRYPEARFVSQQYRGNAQNGVLSGRFTLHGVSRDIDIPVSLIGEGADPWGGYRAGFEGHITLDVREYGIIYDVGPGGHLIELFLAIEGVREKLGRKRSKR
ncbi:YceI family protein [Marinobacterium jannaschii]|uniref:YceI family protein n=1 Tax=Marinobacterium jannaschii TaxID=64970 RepID=UPI0005614EE6|nr:YceI family protein [Marinobacterium jannaschii]